MFLEGDILVHTYNSTTLHIAKCYEKVLYMHNAHSILILLLISYWQHMEIQYTYVLFMYAKIFAVTYNLCYVFCRKFVQLH